MGSRTQAATGGYGRAARFALATLSVLLYARASAAPFASGPQFQVNTYTTLVQSAPRVAVDAAGNFVVVWENYQGSTGSDSSLQSIQAQRFDDDGLPVGTEFQVNTFTTSLQRGPDVAADPAGNFVVVWRSDGSSGSDSSDYSVQAQRFDSAGMPVGTEFQVNTYTTGTQSHQRVAVDPMGNFIVVWRSSGSSGSDSSDASVQGQRFDSAGMPVGTEFQINTYTTSRQWFPSIAVDGAGAFVVSWSSDGSSGSDSSHYSVQAQRFDSAGLPVGSQFQVNTYTTTRQWRSSVGVDPIGNFVVVWESQGSSGPDSSDYSIHGQRFDNGGVPAGTEFEINTYTSSFQNAPSVSFEAGGDFVVVWQSFGSSGSDSSGSSIQGQRFDGAGQPIGTEFQVNTLTEAGQLTASVAADPGGNFVVVWEGLGSSGSDASESSIQGQRFSTVSLCGPAPEADGSCRLADANGAGKSSLQILDSSTNGKDRLKWKWNRGAATSGADFKSPANGDATYRLCIYDGSGTTQPLLEADIPHTLGWQELDTTRFRYKSPVDGTLSGITSVQFKAGAGGKARVQVEGKSSLLHPPATAGLVADVVVQLLIDDGVSVECFKTAFPGSSGAGAISKQDATQFKAKGP